MNNSHQLFELPPDATEAEIRAQYKRLVRIYHPDRFSDLQDQQYVEEKLRAINAAYEMLLARATPDRATASADQLQPQPVAVPTVLDFGTLPPKERKAVLFQVENGGGTAKNFQIDYHRNENWFNVVRGRRLHEQHPFPMEFTVLADTSQLQTNHDYHGWIHIRMDQAVVHVPVAVRVARAEHPVWSRLHVVATLTMLFLVLLLVAFPVAKFSWPTMGKATGAVQMSELAAPSPTSTTIPVQLLTTPLPLPKSTAVVGDEAFEAIQQTPATAALALSADTVETEPQQSAFIRGRSGLKKQMVPTILPPSDGSLQERVVTVTHAVAEVIMQRTTLESTGTGNRAVTPTRTAGQSRMVPGQETIVAGAATPVATATATQAVTPTFSHTITATVGSTATTSLPSAPTHAPTVGAGRTATATWGPPAAAPVSEPPAVPTASALSAGATLRIPAEYNVNARIATSVDAAVVQVLRAETHWLAVGRTIDSSWLYIQLSDGRFAWVFTASIVVDPADVGALPVIIANAATANTH